jgi:DNA invertase Pin-like site-specific DNA recombinase
MKNAKPNPKRTPGRPRRFVPIGQVQDLRQKGLSYRKIARSLGLGYGTVRRALMGAQDQSAAAD